ncbi:melanoma cell adhesion molecule b [Callorhinchus milii]|nr:melanoma cell adhesion molecule b [Callorhinchus milii]
MDNRTFYCQVGAGLLGSSEGMSKLRVYAVPTMPNIQVKSVSASVLATDVSEIAECTSRNGYPAPSIRWYKDRTPLKPVMKRNSKMYMVPQTTETSNKYMTVSSTLYYKLRKQDKDSTFYCEVSYRLPGGIQKMMESKPINISLTYPTENMELTMEPRLVKEDDAVTLKCSGDGSSLGEYSFFRLMDSGEEMGLTSENDILVIERLTRNNTGVYICRAMDMETTNFFEKNINLTVNYLDPVQLTPDRGLNLTRGDTDVKLQCNAFGSQKTSVVWRKDTEKSPLSTTNTLRLPQVGFENAGTYTCEVSVPSVPGLVQSNSISVVVQGAPEMVANSTKISGKEEKHVNLSCTFRGFPKPSITWSAPGNPMMKMFQEDHVVTVVSELVLPLTEEMQKVMCNGTNIQGSKSFLFDVARKVMSPSATGSPTDKDGIGMKGMRRKKSSGGVVIVAIIVCILVLAILGAVLYFLYKKGKISCGRSGKQDITHTDAHDNIVVEAKNEQKVPEETVLLQGVNGEKRPPGDQGEEYADLRSEGK